MRSRTAGIVYALVATLGGALFLGACDSYNDERGKGDSPVGERIEEPRTVIFNIDGYPNLSVICDGTTAIYTTTREAAPVAVPQSEHCPAKGER